MTTDVVVLGSTGSIGRQALEVAAAHPDRFRVAGLACRQDVDRLAEQVRRHAATCVAVTDLDAAAAARDRLGAGVTVLAGDEGLRELAGLGADVVLNGLVGSRGLRPTLDALAAGSRVALANKESLVVGGPLVLAAVTRPDQLVPVDSEHSALAQSLRGGSPAEVERLVLTASGGPFRGWPRERLQDVTVDEALAHPTWSMGRMITVSSATLANKGLEVIEAHLLFGVDYSRIQVVVHPQSVVHSMVEFVDGAVVAKLSPPDMRLPIGLALAWPERLDRAFATMDWTRAYTLGFEPVVDAAGMLALAYAAGRAGGAAPAVYNAANEEAVEAFLDGRLDFLGIPAVVESTLSELGRPPADDLEALLDVEAQARRTAQKQIARR